MVQDYIEKDGVFVIAEVGGNHEGDFNYAKKLCLDAINSGAHAVKFQTYQADNIVSPVEGPVRNKHFKKFELSFEQFEELAQICNEHNVEFMSSLWDKNSFDKLDPIINIHKIGSGDMTNYPLIKYMLQSGKPLIISTAMSTIEEIKHLVSFITETSPDYITEKKLYILHCVAMYGEPKDEYAQLLSIKVLQDTFPKLTIGYSDHTIGMYASELAVAMGAKVIEKHFTDNKDQEFRDHHISADMKEMQTFMTNIQKIRTLLGKYEKKPVLPIESKERIQQFRRSVYACKDINEGEVLDESNITTLRPNTGIDAREYYSLLGNKITQPVKKYHKIDNNIIDQTN